MHRRRQARDSPHVRGFQRQKRTEEAAICGVHVSIRPQFRRIIRLLSGKPPPSSFHAPEKCILSSSPPSPHRRSGGGGAERAAIALILLLLLLPVHIPPLFSFCRNECSSERPSLVFLRQFRRIYFSPFLFSPPPFPRWLDRTRSKYSSFPLPFLALPRSSLLSPPRKPKKVFWRYKEDTH